MVSFPGRINRTDTDCCLEQIVGELSRAVEEWARHENEQPLRSWLDGDAVHKTGRRACHRLLRSNGAPTPKLTGSHGAPRLGVEAIAVKDQPM